MAILHLRHHRQPELRDSLAPPPPPPPSSSFQHSSPSSPGAKPAVHGLTRDLSSPTPPSASKTNLGAVPSSMAQRHPAARPGPPASATSCARATRFVGRRRPGERLRGFDGGNTPAGQLRLGDSRCHVIKVDIGKPRRTQGSSESRDVARVKRGRGRGRSPYRLNNMVCIAERLTAPAHR